MAKIEFPYRERTLEVSQRGETRGWLDDFVVGALSRAISPAEREQFRCGDRVRFGGGEFE